MSSTSVRVGVVGTTPYAESHIARINAHPHAAVVAVAGRDQRKADAVATRHGIAAVFDGYERMLDSRMLDALVIVAPDDLHESIAVRALHAGLHVLCEKPLAASAEAARRMAQAAAASGLVSMSYFALRTSAHHRYLHQLLAGGAIGRVQTAAFSLTHGFFRTSQYNWRFDAALGGGVIADLGCICSISPDGTSEKFAPWPYTGLASSNVRTRTRPPMRPRLTLPSGCSLSAMVHTPPSKPTFFQMSGPESNEIPCISRARTGGWNSSTRSMGHTSVCSPMPTTHGGNRHCPPASMPRRATPSSSTRYSQIGPCGPISPTAGGSNRSSLQQKLQPGSKHG